MFGLIIAFYPAKSIVKNNPISAKEANEMRSNFVGTHQEFTTSDGEYLFLRQWVPENTNNIKKDFAVLLLHGITAHSGAGAYITAGNIIASNGFTVFGLDYRGHGLSGGNRGDYKNKARWIADLTEAVRYIKELGYPHVIVLGHSLGVASAIYLTINVPNEIAGLILLSGAYEGRKKDSPPLPLMKKAKIIASSIFRPSEQVVEYFREGMTGTDDPLFNFSYTLRFLSMLDINELVLPRDLNIPVLVAVGDKDELFEVEKVKTLYDDIPGNKKEFIVLPDTYHAIFPDESWQKLATWLNENF